MKEDKYTYIYIRKRESECSSSSRSRERSDRQTDSSQQQEQRHSHAQQTGIHETSSCCQYILLPRNPLSSRETQRETTTSGIYSSHTYSALLLIYICVCVMFVLHIYICMCVVDRSVGSFRRKEWRRILQKRERVKLCTIGGRDKCLSFPRSSVVLRSFPAFLLSFSLQQLFKMEKATG